MKKGTFENQHPFTGRASDLRGGHETVSGEGTKMPHPIYDGIPSHHNTTSHPGNARPQVATAANCGYMLNTLRTQKHMFGVFKTLALMKLQHGRFGQQEHPAFVAKYFASLTLACFPGRFAQSVCEHKPM